MYNMSLNKKQTSIFPSIFELSPAPLHEPVEAQLHRNSSSSSGGSEKKEESIFNDITSRNRISKFFIDAESNPTHVENFLEENWWITLRRAQDSSNVSA